MRHRIGMAIWCLRISQVIYLAIPFLFAWLLSILEEDPIPIGVVVLMLMFCIPLVVGLEFVVQGLRRRKFWAWVVGIVVFGTYATSAFLPLGAFGLWGLLDSGSRAEFGIGASRPQ
jgi:hypothetical protein